jgi:hypothetical protein
MVDSRREGSRSWTTSCPKSCACRDNKCLKPLVKKTVRKIFLSVGSQTTEQIGGTRLQGETTRIDTRQRAFQENACCHVFFSGGGS